MHPKRPVVALDLEGTLISNAMSQIPRPGLFEFLTACRELFTRVVMYTTVKEPQFRDIATLLVKEGVAPRWFAEVEYVTWAGKTKDLNFVAGADVNEIILVDDFEDYVHPGQKPQWLRIDHFAPPYAASDQGLEKALRALEKLTRDDSSVGGRKI